MYAWTQRSVGATARERLILLFIMGTLAISVYRDGNPNLGFVS
jgi:hypothetical protein